MEPIHTFPPCSKCPLRQTGQLNVPVLVDFIHDSLLMDMNHYFITEQILSESERERYYLRHAQVELLLSLLRGLKVHD